MKETLYKIIFFSLLMVLFSCQDVVDVDLKTGKERLVVEALIKWLPNTTGADQQIKLSKTTSFYNTERIPATNASVVIKNTSDLTEFHFTETEDGIYQTHDFIPMLNATYQLEINYQDQIYQATSTLLEAPEIASIYQSTAEGFSTEFPEVNLIFQDFENQSDYYRVSFEYYKPTNTTLDNYELKDHLNYIFDDSFQENNAISIFYENEDLQPNDKIKISLYSITRRFYNYLEKIEEQANSNPGPFSLPPINVKGNIVNTSNAYNYPYGYFSLNKVQAEEYIFQ